MRTYLINPFAFEIGQPPVRKHIHSGDYRDISGLLGEESIGLQVSVFTTISINSDGDTLYVDDEGLLKGPQGFIFIRGYPEPLAGKGLVMGEGPEGESADCKADLGWLMSCVTLVSFREGWQFAHRYQNGDWKAEPLHKFGRTGHEVILRLAEGQ